MTLSFFEAEVQAGFPSVADDFLEKKLDLNDLLIKHPSATFFVKVAGDSMQEAGIFPGDILVVDRAEKVLSGRIIIALLNGEFAVKRFVKREKRCFLESANPLYPPLALQEGDEFQVWGVVTYVIHRTP